MGRGKEPGPAGRGGRTIESRGIAVELLPSGDGGGSAGARLWIRVDGAWRDAGLLLPLAEVTSEEGGVLRRTIGTFRRIAEEHGDGIPPQARRDVLDGLFLMPVGDRRHLFLQIVFAEKPGLIEVGAWLNEAEQASVLRFAGPAVRRIAAGPDPLDRHALFGGLEILEPGWRSSSERGVGPRFAVRWSPPAWQVTVPAMAIEMDGITTSVLWNPLDGPRPPSPAFASPDSLEGQEGSHRMGLSVDRPAGGDSLSFSIRVAREEPALLAARDPPGEVEEAPAEEEPVLYDPDSPSLLDDEEAGEVAGGRRHAQRRGEAGGDEDRLDAGRGRAGPEEGRAPQGAGGDDGTGDSHARILASPGDGANPVTRVTGVPRTRSRAVRPARGTGRGSGPSRPRDRRSPASSLPCCGRAGR